jgi:hypothetical protein
MKRGQIEKYNGSDGRFAAETAGIDADRADRGVHDPDAAHHHGGPAGALQGAPGAGEGAALGAGRDPQAIDKYKDATGANLLPAGKIDSDGYPESLQQLVDGVRPNGSPDKKLRFLRRIPKDPMTNSFEWGLRSTRDDPDATGWGGQNVFDVYTKSMDKAPDGTAYAEW